MHFNLTHLQSRKKPYNPIVVFIFMFSTLLQMHGLFAFSPPEGSGDPMIIPRAAIDFGSGAIKIQMGLVDIEQNKIIGEPLLAKFTALCMTEDVANNAGKISEEIQEQALQILKAFKEEALLLAAERGFPHVHFTGIATAVFRKASNGKDFLDKLNQILKIKFQVLNQTEEGKLGFLTAQAIHPNIAPEKLIAWDSGNGSFQFTVFDGETYHVYQGPFGLGTIRVLLSKDVRNGPILQGLASENPVSREEAAALKELTLTLLPAIPDWLQSKLEAEDAMIVSFGDRESIFAMTAQALAASEGSKQAVIRAAIPITGTNTVIKTFIEKEDTSFDVLGLHRKTLTGALLLSTVMEWFGITCVNYTRTIGNAPGMLIYPVLWSPEASSTFPTAK